MTLTDLLSLHRALKLRAEYLPPVCPYGRIALKRLAAARTAMETGHPNTAALLLEAAEVNLHYGEERARIDWLRHAAHVEANRPIA